MPVSHPCSWGSGKHLKGLSRLSKTFCPGLNYITWHAGTIPWGCAAYSISLCREQEPAEPLRDGLCCQAQQPRDCPSVAGPRVSCPNQPPAWLAAMPSPFQPAALPSSPSLDVCPFPSTSTPLEASPSAALTTFPEERFTFSNVPSAGQTPTSQRRAPKRSLRPHFSPVLAAPVAIAFMGHGWKVRLRHLGLPHAPQVQEYPTSIPRIPQVCSLQFLLPLELSPCESDPSQAHTGSCCGAALREVSHWCKMLFKVMKMSNFPAYSNPSWVAPSPCIYFKYFVMASQIAGNRLI